MQDSIDGFIKSLNNEESVKFKEFVSSYEKTNSEKYKFLILQSCKNSVIQNDTKDEFFNDSLNYNDGDNTIEKM